MALSVATLVIVFALLGIVLSTMGVTGWPLWPLFLSAGSSLFIVGAWILIISRRYVRIAAERYADALLATADEPEPTT